MDIWTNWSQEIPVHIVCINKTGKKFVEKPVSMGYMVPDCAITGKASKESDVYSFGIVALEIACGRKIIDLKAKENQIVMVKWIWDLYGTGRLLEGADTKLQADFDEEQMEHLMIVGLCCAHPDSSIRSSIRQAIHVLDFEAQLPILPSQNACTNILNSEVSVLSHHGNVYGSIGLQSSNYSCNTGSSGLTASSKSDFLFWITLAHTK